VEEGATEVAGRRDDARVAVTVRPPAMPPREPLVPRPPGAELREDDTTIGPAGPTTAARPAIDDGTTPGSADGAPTHGSTTRGGATPTLGTLSALHGPTPTVSLPKPETVLRRAAHEQTRRTAMSGVVFNVVALVAAPFFGGEAWAMRLFVAAVGIAALNNAWLLVACRTGRYRQRWALVYFAISTVPNAGVLLHLGTFGPILVMFVLNVYTACLAYTRRVARMVLIGSLVPFVALGVLIASGLLRDPGIISAGDAIGRGPRFVLVGAFAAFLIMTYRQARETRDLMVASLVERDGAVRLASHREALLLEARQDLERALHAGGLGRFSGQTLGSFELGPVIGRGGMGEVYEATHATTREPAAVKLLLPEVLGRPEYVRRFLREVAIAGSLRSPHVVQVLEVGDESAPMPYLAMERLRGEDLAQILRERPRMDPAEVVDMVRQVARGVTAAAAAGIVHRDLKPQNLFRAQGSPPTWKILDFGVSKLEGDGGTLTRGEAVGTPRYMAPEQAKGEPVDTRADVYALGAIAYRALTGQPPFRGDDGAPILLQVITRMPARPAALARLPADVDLALAVGLAKRPGDRFADADSLARAIEAAVEGRLDDNLRARARALLDALPWARG
jgi:serine/threonine-protein kinase